MIKQPFIAWCSKQLGVNYVAVCSSQSRPRGSGASLLSQAGLASVPYANEALATFHQTYLFVIRSGNSAPVAPYWLNEHIGSAVRCELFSVELPARGLWSILSSRVRHRVFRPQCGSAGCLPSFSLPRGRPPEQAPVDCFCRRRRSCHS